ncbi:MAG: YHS domain-containing protein [Actinobacteria bacterium]|nr:YHS domain-containing protein [Actinomycetota bacterium]
MLQNGKDPVCGMEISPEDAVATEDHDGQTFYFCSHACHEAFVKDPVAMGIRRLDPTTAGVRNSRRHPPSSIPRTVG